MGVSSFYENTGFVPQVDIAKTPVLHAISGQQFIIDKVIVRNASGGAINVGWGYVLGNSMWKAGQWDDSETASYIDDTTDAQDGGTGDFASFTVGTNNDGFVVQATQQFNIVYLDVSTANNNGTIEYTYWNGSSWAALTLRSTPTLTSTGDKYIVFDSPHDWTALTATSTPVATDGLSVNMYAIRVRATTAPSVTAMLVSSMKVITLVDTFDQLEDNGQFISAFDGEHPLPGDCSVIGYFATADAENALNVTYRRLK